MSAVRRCFLFFFFLIFSGGVMSRGGGLSSLARFGGRGRRRRRRRPGTHLFIFLDCPHLPLHHCPSCPSLFPLGALRQEVSFFPACKASSFFNHFLPFIWGEFTKACSV